MKINKIIKVSFFIAVISILSISSHAQLIIPPSNPGGQGSGPGSPILPDVSSGGPSGVPFDGGLSLILIAAGAGVGAKRKKKMAEAV